jgi:hypothetical protein
MTLLRGLADDLRLDVWLLGYMMPVEREFVSPDFCRLGTLLACAEMIRGGVTCFADMYYFEDAVAQATSDAGMRGLCSQTVLKFPTPDAASFEDSLAAARDFIGRWRGHPLILPSVAPHAPFTCTPEILRACADLAIEFDVRCIRTWRRRRSKWTSHARNMGCRSSRGPRRRGSSRPRCWRLTVSMSTRARYGRWRTPLSAWRTTRRAT